MKIPSVQSNVYFNQLKDSFWNSLSPLQKKVSLLGVAIIGLITLALTYYYCIKNKITKEEKPLIDSAKINPPENLPPLEEMDTPKENPPIGSGTTKVELPQEKPSVDAPQVKSSEEIIYQIPDNYNSFKEKISIGMTLVYCIADWCKPIKITDECIKSFAKHKEIQGKVFVARLDVDKASSVSDALEVTQLPTYIIFQNGKEKCRASGVSNFNKKSLIEAINKVKSDSLI